MYHTVKLFLDTGGVSNCKRSSQPHMILGHRLLMMLGQELSEILSRKPKIMAREMDIALRTMSCIIKQDFGLGAFK